VLIPHKTGCRSRKSIHPTYRLTGLYHIPSIESPTSLHLTNTLCPFPIPVGYEVTWHKVTWHKVNEVVFSLGVICLEKSQKVFTGILDRYCIKEIRNALKFSGFPSATTSGCA
jgi:hypothetical protein